MKSAYGGTDYCDINNMNLLTGPLNISVYYTGRLTGNSLDYFYSIVYVAQFMLASSQSTLTIQSHMININSTDSLTESFIYLPTVRIDILTSSPSQNLLDQLKIYNLKVFPNLFLPQSYMEDDYLRSTYDSDPLCMLLFLLTREKSLCFFHGLFTGWRTIGTIFIDKYK